MLFRIGRYTLIRFGVDRADDDPEKLLLPGVILTPARHSYYQQDRFNGFGLAIGWWDFSLYFGMLWPSPETRSQIVTSGSAYEGTGDYQGDARFERAAYLLTTGAGMVAAAGWLLGYAPFKDVVFMLSVGIVSAVMYVLSRRT